MKESARYVVLTAIPLTALLALLAYYAVDSVYWDEWEIVLLLDKFYKHALTFRDIFAQHNEHRIALTKIIILLNAIYLRWNIYLEIAVNVLLAAGTSIVIYYAVGKLDFLDIKKRMLIYFTSAGLILSFSQYDNFMWGFQMEVFMSVFFDFLALCLLVYGGNAGIFAAMFFGVLGTFSFANGMMIWPAGFVILCISAYIPEGKFRLWKVLVWSVLSLASIYLYFYDFRYGAMQMPVNEKVIYLLTHPHVMFILFASYLGLPLSNMRQSAALGLGILGLIIQAWSLITIIRRRSWNRNISFWLGIDIYALLSAAVTSFGRSHSISSTMQYRYITICMIFWLAVIALFFIAADFGNDMPVKTYLVISSLILCLSVSEDALINARKKFEDMTAFKQQINAGIYDNEHFLSKLYPDRAGAARIALMKRYGVRGYENAPETIEFNDFRQIEFDSENINAVYGTYCSIDESFMKGKDFYCIEGWWKIDSFLEKDRKIARSYIIFCNETSAFEAILLPEGYNIKKVLRAKKYSNPYEMSKRNYVIGNQLYVGNLPSGTYKLFLKVNQDGHDYYMPMNETVTVEH